MDGQSILDTVMTLFLLLIFAYISQEFQTWKMVNEIEVYLIMYKTARDRAVAVTTNTFKKLLPKSSSSKRIELEKIRNIEERIRELVDFTVIDPVDLDPYGIVRKIKHIIRVTERTVENEIKGLLPSVSRNEIKNLIDLVDATRVLNFIYKYLDHNYRIARKFKSLWLLMQIYALLPFITQEVRALENAIEAFNKGLPVGDSIGPLVASKLIMKYDGLKNMDVPVKDTIVTRVTIEGREVYIVKARGPGGTTGRLDDAIEWLFENVGKKFSMIITVDAASKFEGEKSGTIIQGFGVAIGGVGVERFNIEEIASRYNVPLYAILIKMSEIEALSILTKELYESADKAVSVIERVIKERSNANDKIILIGVGNTIGVAP
ncbi:MAG: hypothetical protein B6U94_01445 [Thermofilum sp. ex4484_79]|nr:MAG: hypothetical protein B6U94_01445 [Thermofilum sp. ex4484_79]